MIYSIRLSVKFSFFVTFLDIEQALYLNATSAFQENYCLQIDLADSKHSKKVGYISIACF